MLNKYGDTVSLYFHPEAFGLQTIVSENISEPYEFDLFVLWQHENGQYFCAWDSGCSCPLPFEDVRSTDDLHLVKDAVHLDTLIDGWLGEKSCDLERLNILNAYHQSIK